RYHALFAEAMRQAARQRLGDSAVRAMHETASQWYEAHDLLTDAVEEALSAENYPRAAAIIERLLDVRGFNELYILRTWLERLPVPLLREHPGLCFANAFAMLFTLDRFDPAVSASVLNWLQVAEATWRTEKNDPRLGQVLALRGLVYLWRGDMGRAFAECRES